MTYLGKLLILAAALALSACALPPGGIPDNKPLADFLYGSWFVFGQVAAFAFLGFKVGYWFGFYDGNETFTNGVSALSGVVELPGKGAFLTVKRGKVFEVWCLLEAAPPFGSDCFRENDGVVANEDLKKQLQSLLTASRLRDQQLELGA